MATSDLSRSKNLQTVTFALGTQLVDAARHRMDTDVIRTRTDTNYPLPRYKLLWESFRRHSPMTSKDTEEEQI